MRAYGKNFLEFAILTGVLQGCVMAPALFNIFLGIVTKLSLQNHQKKVLPLLYHLSEQKLVSGRKKYTNKLLLNNMAYANDMALLADSKSELEEILRSFHSTCSLMGLTISKAKAKMLAILPFIQTEPATPPGEDDVQVVDTFAHLSCIMEKNCSIDAEVNCCIKNASKAFSSLSRVLWYQKRIRTSTKLHLLKAAILPVLMYGLESAVLLSHHV